MISIYLEDQFLTVNNDIFQKNDTMYDMTEIKRWVKAAEIYNKWIKKRLHSQNLFQYFNEHLAFSINVI